MRKRRRRGGLLDGEREGLLRVGVLLLLMLLLVVRVVTVHGCWSVEQGRG